MPHSDDREGEMDFSILSGLRHGAQAPQIGMEMTGIATVRAYWEALRQDGGIPARSEIDPRGISTALDRVFLAERIGPGLAQLRIAGSALFEIAGIDPRGLPLSCLFAPEARNRLQGLLEHVFTAPGVADLTFEAGRTFGGAAVAGRLLMLPLRDAAGGHTLIMGCLDLQGAVRRAPCRFDILRAVEERLSIPQPARPADDWPSRPGPRAHLRLVHSAN